MTIIETVDGGDEPVDQEFLDLVARLMPFFVDTATQVFEKSVEDSPRVTHRPALVAGVDIALRTASVLCDGDTTPITAQVKTELPYSGARVFVEFWPDGSVFVSGFITPCGIPVGASLDFHGAITRHAGAVATDATPGEPPAGFELEAGQAVSRSTRAALFSVIGTVHGAGDGATTFNVPDTRGRVGVGVDNMGGSDAGRLSAANTLGGSGGAETHTFATTNLPPHTHDLGNHTHAGPSHTHSFSATTGNPSANHTHDMNDVYNQGGLYGVTNGAGAGNAINNVSTRATAGMSADHTHSVSGTTGSGGTGATGAPSSNTSGSTGSGTAVNHMPPYFLVNKIIKC